MGLQAKLTRKITRQRMREFVARNATDSRTLDLGGAESPFTQYFPNRVCCDIADKPDVDVVADAHDLPFDDNEFDTILSNEMLEHLHTPEKAIAEMRRVLKPGGRLILTTRFVFPIHDAPHDYYRYTKYGMRHLFRDWEIVELVPEVTTMETMAVLYQRLGFQTQMRLNAVSKLMVFVTARMLELCNWLIVKEYGDIKRSVEEEGIMTSGYYIVCTNTKD